MFKSVAASLTIAAAVFAGPISTPAPPAPVLAATAAAPIDVPPTFWCLLFPHFCTR